MSNQPVVSIGMPVYNGAKDLRKALDSLLAQTFYDFELIISDNASADETEFICRQYAQQETRIRYFRQKQNMGAVNNFQFVLDEAVGEYFMWAAADDVWDETWIEKLLPKAIGEECLYYGMVQSIDDDGKDIRHPANRRAFNYRGSRYRRRLKYFLDPGILGKANPIYGIMPLSVVKKTGIAWIESEPCCGDMIFLYGLLQKIEIRSDDGVRLRKRVSRDAANLINSKRVVGPWTPVRLIRAAGRDTMLRQYMRRSNRIESLLLLATWPMCLTFVTLSRICCRFMYGSE